MSDTALLPTRKGARLSTSATGAEVISNPPLIKMLSSRHLRVGHREDAPQFVQQQSDRLQLTHRRAQSQLDAAARDLPPPRLTLLRRRRRRARHRPARIGGDAAAEGLQGGTAISSNALLTVNPAPVRPTYDLSLDYSLSSNPNGVWSYGWEASLGSPFSVLTVPVIQPAVAATTCERECSSDKCTGGHPKYHMAKK